MLIQRTPSLRPNYTEDEVEALIEGYSELSATRHKLYLLVRLCDLDLAIRAMPPKEYQATLLVGLIGIDIRAAGVALGVSHQTAWRRYRRGITWITDFLNST